jgi:hypothetical protein
VTAAEESARHPRPRPDHAGPDRAGRARTRHDPRPGARTHDLGAHGRTGLSDADRLIEGARTGGRSGYQRAARRSVAYGRGFRPPSCCNGGSACPASLARMTADRFELLLSQRLILRDLGGFIDGRIRRIHGRRVADLLQELLARRIERWKPRSRGCACNTRATPRNWNAASSGAPRSAGGTRIRGDARGRADRGRGLHHADAGLARRRAAAEERPPLDIALQRTELVRQFPLFADLDDGTLKRLGRAADPLRQCGDVVMRKDAGAQRVLHRLGRGRTGNRRPDLAARAGRDVRPDGHPDEPGAPRRGPRHRALHAARAGRGGSGASYRQRQNAIRGGRHGVLRSVRRPRHHPRRLVELRYRQRPRRHRQRPYADTRPRRHLRRRARGFALPLPPLRPVRRRETRHRRGDRWTCRRRPRPAARARQHPRSRWRRADRRPPQRREPDHQPDPPRDAPGAQQDGGRHRGPAEPADGPRSLRGGPANRHLELPVERRWRPRQDSNLQPIP